jgi:uncharacterized membrane protein YdjX (TVP38/TMEM64 family)
MRRYAAIAAIVGLVLLACFAAVEALDVGLLTDPRDTLAGGGVGVALIAVGLLVADVVLPVPSSIVMVSLGAAYGLVLGAALATVGSVLAAVLAFAIGRRSDKLVDRVVSHRDRSAFAQWFERRGDLAIIVSRPLPIVAETVAGLAGTTAMPARRFVPVVILGTLPASIAYSSVGAAVAEFDSGTVTAVAVVVVAAVFWSIGEGTRRWVTSTSGGSDVVAVGGGSPSDVARGGVSE